MQCHHSQYHNQGIFVYYKNRWYNETDKKNQHRIIRYISEDLFTNVKERLTEAIELSDDNRTTLWKKLREHTSNNCYMRDIFCHILSVQAGKHTNVRFDEKPYLLGFENGVVELITKTFRPYKFDDYITLTTKYDYKPIDDTDENKEMRKTLFDRFNEIQPSLERIKLLTQILASGLDGIQYQKFWFFNGRGGNGKGLIAGLMRKVLGENFCISPKEEILKEVGKNTGASPDIADLRYKRYIIFTELGGTIKLTSFRRLTGGDALTARQLYSGNQCFKPSATMVGDFNVSPDFDGKPTDADYRRAMNVNFPNNYTDEVNKINKTVNGIFYQKGNPYYVTDEFVEKAKLVFLDILLDKYVEFYSHEIKGICFDIPDEIRKASKAFVDETNVFKQIFDELYRPAKENETKTRTKLSEIWELTQYHSKYKELSSNAKKQYARDSLYEWVSINYTVEGKNSKAKYITGFVSTRIVDDDDDDDDEGV